jgi:hypothetical protein
MALSSEDRSVFSNYARNLRADPSLIAVADHLARCEALLKEIGGRIPDWASPEWAGFKERIATLLGLATEEKTE